MSSQPHKTPGLPNEPLRLWLEKEAQYLTGIMSGASRARRYRHHLFFQDSAEVLRLTLGILQQVKQASPEDALRVRVSRVLRRCIAAGESAVNELRLHRVDTIPVALALVAVLARLHLLWTCASAGGATISMGLRQPIQRQSLPAQGSAPDISDVSTSLCIGGLIDVLAARSSASAVGRKRQREV